MNNSVPQNEYNFSLWKCDKVNKYKSKWPIYELDNLHSKGLWLKFKNVLKKLEENKKLQILNVEDIENFYNDYPDIDFEIKVFSNVMKKNYIFKLKNKTYSYTIGYKSKRKIYARFYFDINNFFIDIADY
jgi:hypothetical protein